MPQVYHNTGHEINSDFQAGRKAIGILAKRGAGFVLMDRRSKGSGLRTGWNDPANVATRDEALRHLRSGGNVGLATGTGDLYVLDFDRDADRGHECAQLAGGMYTYRANAPHKAKFIFRCADRIPTRVRSTQDGLDLLGWTKFHTDHPRHTNAVIAGVHDSGAPILWGGHSIPTLDAETVAELWREWTGQELFPARRERSTTEQEYDDDDLATVADALSHVDPWSLDYAAWIAVLAALKSAFGDAAYDLACEWGDEGVEERWGSFGDYEGGATLASIFYHARNAGWVDRRREQFHARVLHARAWLATAAAAAALDAAGVRYTTGRKLLDALYEMAGEWGGATIRPGLRLLASRAAMGVAAVRTNLARLAAAGMVSIGDIDPEQRFVAPAIKVELRNDHSSTPPGTTVIVLQNYSDHRCDDAFRNNHAAYKNRVPDGLAPLGESALPALAQLLDGDSTVTEIADALGVPAHGIRRALARAHEYGLVTYTTERHNRRRYALTEEWRETLTVIRRNMTTYGLAQRRADAYQEARLESAKRSGDRVRIERATAAYNAHMAHSWCGPDPAQWVKGRRRSARTWQRWDRAEVDQALAALRTEIHRLRAAHMTTPDIRRVMTYAGYDPQDVSRAMAAVPEAVVR